ncbi:putative Receptor protein kinase CLAVATA1 precursor [Hibiscus syriacus]|uniref:Receptor protein kinase CLAVATA1 n=1 Tax=Hibiscus syriacus TaxID=106335 RepID=A0A6A3BEZ1_HIBSY|nr:protein ZW2-like [Hibiscus syriacus]KAE8715606.1 putative Receptor protein kinase CLAVATA1 precursor [Hibiscus syriacus]
MAASNDDWSIAQNFENFFNGWLVRQEGFHERLVQALRSQDEDQIQQRESLIHQVVSHYEQYLVEKSTAAKERVLLFYSPPWLTCFEKALLWFGGFKPFLLFKLLANSVPELTPEQEEAIERVKCETRREERELTQDSATIQESLAALPLLNLIRRYRGWIDEELSELESAMEEMKVEMLRVLERADKLRCSTVRKLLQTLSPIQKLQFLSASTEFQLTVRKWGLQNDQQRSR